MVETPLFRSSAGIDWSMIEDEKGTSYRAVAPTDPIIERNKAMRTHNDGYTPSRELRRVAVIPFILIEKWKNEEGWDALNPEHSDKLVQKLNDPDWAYLRSADGQIGISNGIVR